MRALPHRPSFCLQAVPPPPPLGGEEVTIPEVGLGSATTRGGQRHGTSFVSSVFRTVGPAVPRYTTPHRQELVYYVYTYIREVGVGRKHENRHPRQPLLTSTLTSLPSLPRPFSLCCRRVDCVKVYKGEIKFASGSGVIFTPEGHLITNSLLVRNALELKVPSHKSKYNHMKGEAEVEQ